MLTIEADELPDGYRLIRSDGERFRLVWTGGADATLYHVSADDQPPPLGLVDFDGTITNKLESAHRYALAYPNSPSDQR